MINRKTVFIVGAGASQEFGLPTGDELKKRISKLVNIGFDLVGGDHSGDEEIVCALRERAPKKTRDGRGGINSYLHAAQDMIKALPIAISIDNYLEAHANDREATLIGKLGIVQSILQAEKNSKLMVKPDLPENTINYELLEDAWLKELFLKLNEGVSTEKLEHIFSSVSFISFNYDRCIKQFLWYALSTYYKLKEKDDLVRYLSKLNVFHPYGSVGELDWETEGRTTAFGSAKSYNLLNLSDRIKTYSEQVEDEALLAAMKNSIQKSSTIVFLGFAFHSQNMDLLKCGLSHKDWNVYFTTYGMSEPDIVAATLKIRRTFSVGTDQPALNIVPVNMTCGKFMQGYKSAL